MTTSLRGDIMNMVNFFYSVTNHLQSVNPYATIKFDLLDTPSESIMFRFTPNAPASKMWIGKRRDIQFRLSTKSKNQIKAYEMLCNMNDVLELKNDGLLGADFRLISCESYIEPSFVEKTEASEFIYTALYKAEVEEI